MIAIGNSRKILDLKRQAKGFDEYRHYGENNLPLKDTQGTDPCDDWSGMSNPGDKNYEC